MPVKFKNIRKVLVVDDETEIVKSVQRHLKRLGILARSAANGFEAQQLISGAAERGKPYHLVITDIIMPVADGVDLLNWIKTNRPEIAVLVISGFGASFKVMDALRPELDAYCQKPLTPDKMIAAMEDIEHKKTVAARDKKGLAAELPAFAWSGNGE